MWTGSTGPFWELVNNSKHQKPPETHWARICIWTRSLSGLVPSSYLFGNWRSGNLTACPRSYSKKLRLELNSCCSQGSMGKTKWGHLTLREERGEREEVSGSMPNKRKDIQQRAVGEKKTGGIKQKNKSLVLKKLQSELSLKHSMDFHLNK